MIGRDLIAAMRETHLDDTKLPYLWSDNELLRNLNYAEVQSCRRAHLIIDGSTANDSGTAGTASTMGQKPLCTLSITAGTATYNLSPKILQVKRCQLASMTYPLAGPLSYAQLDDLSSGWMGTAGSIGTAGSGGYPVGFLNEPGNTITFILVPSVNDTAYLVVSRLPLIPFSFMTSPEIDEHHHEGLMDWAAHLAFMKPDADTQNLSLAKYYEDAFTAKFGVLPSARDERIKKRLSMQQRMRAREFGS